MTRMLTAAVALTAALGMAGLAQAQSSTSTMTGPSGSQNPAAMGGATSGGTGAYGTQTLRANTQMPNQGQMNQARVNQNTAPASREEIQQAQQQLKSQGLYRGSVDGVMGPETQTALMAFQREQGLPQTAQLDQQTLGRLGGNGGTTGGASTQQQPRPAGMQPGGANAPAPAGGMNGAPGSPGAAITR